METIAILITIIQKQEKMYTLITMYIPYICVMYYKNDSHLHITYKFLYLHSNKSWTLTMANKDICHHL